MKTSNLLCEPFEIAVPLMKPHPSAIYKTPRLPDTSTSNRQPLAVHRRSAQPEALDNKSAIAMAMFSKTSKM